MKRVYLDNAATTPLAPEVLEAMLPYLQSEFGNPSSTHYYGRQTKAAIERARRTVSSLLNCTPGEIIFTSGGTEADNMAISCSVRDMGVTRVISSPLEHHAVIHTCESLKDVELEWVRIKEDGHVDLEHLRELLAGSEQKTLVSLMHGNNEIGNLLPLEQVSGLCREHGALFHSDTVQTMGHYPFDLQELDVDFLTCAAHKLHGPKGVGFLYVNKKLKVKPLISGGGQERNMRGGTENLYGIVGLAKALELANEDIKEHQQHVQGLKSWMIEALKESIPGVGFNGDITPENSLYTVLSVSLPESSKGDLMLFTLDLNGVAASGGSACSSGANKGSHVLSGIGADPKRTNVRFSFSRYTTQEEVEYAVKVVKDLYAKEIIPLSPSHQD